MIGSNYHLTMQEPEDPRLKAARRQLSQAEEATGKNDYRLAVQILLNCTREMINFSAVQASVIHRLKRKVTGTARQTFQQDDDLWPE